jgi:hypothetical protein
MWTGFEVIFINIVMVVLFLSEIIRLGESLFGLPNPFEKWKLEREKKRLQVLGVLPSYHAQVAQYIAGDHKITFPNHEEVLKILLKKYTCKLGKRMPLGRGDQRIEARYYIDFNAPTATDLDAMAEILAKFIYGKFSTIDMNLPAFNLSKLAVPHRGNPALGIALTRHDPFRNIAYTLIGDPAIRDWRFSGAKVKPDDTFILIDDLTASGHSLLSCVKILRDEHATVNHAFVLVERTDASNQKMPRPADILKENNVTLHAFWAGGDKELGQIFRTGK